VEFWWAGCGVQVDFAGHTLDRLAENGEAIDWW
jgi:hypothetical protein